MRSAPTSHKRRAANLLLDEDAAAACAPLRSDLCCTADTRHALKWQHAMRCTGGVACTVQQLTYSKCISLQHPKECAYRNDDSSPLPLQQQPGELPAVRCLVLSCYGMSGALHVLCQQ